MLAIPGISKSYPWHSLFKITADKQTKALEVKNWSIKDVCYTLVTSIAVVGSNNCVAKFGVGGHFSLMHDWEGQSI